MAPVPLDLLATLSLFLGFYAKAIGALAVTVLAVVLAIKLAGR